MLNFILNLIVGAVSGWLAGEIMHNRGTLLRNIALGIVGGLVGGFVLGLIGLSGHGIIGNIVVSVIGACVLIGGYNALVKK